MKNSQKNSTEKCHFYSREKSLYIAWACFRNVLLLSDRYALAKEQSDQGLHYLPFCSYLFTAFQSVFFSFRVITVIYGLSEVFGLFWYSYIKHISQK